MTIDGENLQADSGLISGPVVAQYFGFFNGVPKEHYDHIVATAPFQDCNLLILAFVHTVQKNGIYIADFTNGRDDPNYPAKPGDMDIDRVKLVVKTARAKNPSLKILVSLGWGNNDAGLAAQTPGPFADSVCAIVQTLGLDGLDIDYESTDVTASQMLTLAQTLWLSLTKQGDAEARYRADHYSGISPDWFIQQLGGYDRIVYGLNSEGYIGESDNPAKFAELAKKNRAAGIFAWRLDNDSVSRQTTYPEFTTGIKMWSLMHQEKIRVTA
jgi:GH18 family chitinase